MGFFFNLDPRFMKFLQSHANDRDLKSIRFMAIHFLELWKEEFVNEYGLEAWNELYDRYNITNEDEGRISRKKKIGALKVLGWSEEDARVLCTMSKEDLKLYTDARKQKNWNDQNEIPKQKREKEKNQAERVALLQEKRELEPTIELYRNLNKPEKLKEAEERLKTINEKLGVEVE